MPTTTRAPAGFTDSGGRAERLLKLAGLVHLRHDVGPADELAVDVELRDRRPVGVALDALPNGFVFENVDGLQIVNAARLQDLDCPSRKAAHRELGGPLHEEHDAVALHQ